MHDVHTSRAEPIRDSEGLLVTGSLRVITIRCNTCGWVTTTDTADLALALAEDHRNEP